VLSPLERAKERLKLALSKGPNREGVTPLTRGWKQIHFSKRVLKFFRTQDDGQSPNPVILSIIHHCQNPLESK
jgi:hypothetical protein